VVGGTWAHPGGGVGAAAYWLERARKP